MTLFSLSLILFLIIDPLGSVTTFKNQLSVVPEKRRDLVAARELFTALCLMLLFNMIGESMFFILDVSETTVRLGSGVILFIAALRILYPKGQKNDAPPTSEPKLVPLVIPSVASPALLATIMLFAHLIPSTPTMLLAIFLAWLPSAIILFRPNLILSILGKAGLMACEKLMGMILVLLAIQRFMDGLQSFFSSL